MLSNTNPTATPEVLEDFYRELEGFSLAPLWNVQEEALVKEPTSKASPYMLGLPLMTAMFCKACIGARPNSMPHWTATNTFAGLPWYSLGTMIDLLRTSENCMASDKVVGTKLFLVVTALLIIQFLHRKF